MLEEEATFSVLHANNGGGGRESPECPSKNPVYGRCFRRALLSRVTDKQSPRDYLKTLFPDQERLSINQFKGLLKTLEVVKFLEDGEDGEGSAMKFYNNFIKDLHLFHENEVQYQELCLYLWTKGAPFSSTPTPSSISSTNSSNRHISLTITMTRNAIIDCLGERIVNRSKKSKKDDLFLTEAFAKKTGIQLVRGSLLSTRHLKKSLPRFLNGYLGEEISAETVDQLIQSLDSNSDGVVSAREFKAWLFSTNSESPDPALGAIKCVGGDETDTDTELVKQPVADTPPVDYVESDQQEEEYEEGDPSGYGADDDEDDRRYRTEFTTPEIEALTPLNSEHGGSTGVVSEGGLSDHRFREGDQEGNKSPQKPQQSSQQASCCQCMLGSWGFRLIYEPVGE
jgi:hypothetical protein